MADTLSNDVDLKRANRRARLWMIAFFIALLAFEIAREWAVVVSNEEPNLATLATVTSWNGSVLVEGRWRTTDKGDRLEPNMVRIECDQTAQTCDDTEVHANGNFIIGPYHETHHATFGDGIVEYTKDYSCASYLVRIDTKTQMSFFIRTKKPSQAGVCTAIKEQRMEGVLGNGYDDREDPAKGHFLPVLTLSKAVAQLF